MNETFAKLYRQLGRVTRFMLFATLTFIGLNLFAAILGFRNAADSFRGVWLNLAIVFLVLFGLFLATSVVAAVVEWLERRKVPHG